MAADDAALKTEYETFQNELNNLALRVPKGERDEGKSAEHQARVEKLGTELVLHIKRHQVAVATWLSEAVYRDRGPVD